MKNYYQILNIRPTATDAEIKRNYRVLAKRYHPDVNPGDAAAADKFADINEANSVLSDPKSRAEYDAKLKEASAPRLKPEDIIARQRAQAQAAARQAAARQAQFRNASAGASGVRSDPVAMARARQAAQAQAMRQAQYKQAQAQAQAQVSAIREQAFRQGRDQGITAGRAAAEAEMAKLNAQIRAFRTENQKLAKSVQEAEELKEKLSGAENDRRDLEKELFERDRELTAAHNKIKEMEERVREFMDEDGSKREATRKASAENAALREKLEDVQRNVRELEKEKREYELAKRHSEQNIKKLEQEKAKLEQNIKTLEQDRKQAELNGQAQLQLQQEKRKQLQAEVDMLNKKLADLTAEFDEIRSENDQWQQYAKSEQFISDTERRLDEWAKKTQADRRLAKPTHYGALGVLIWVTDEEIKAAFAKLVKRYTGKSDDAARAKLAKVKEAYEVLSDPEKRAEYNASIGITPERIEEERRLIKENESLTEEYRNRLANKEFWVHFDELTATALQGDVNAQYTLGDLYYTGEEVDRDFEQAAFWFKEAAKQKHADAMYGLGICFVNGEGVEKNEATGNGFIRQAAKLGSKAAKKYLAGIKEE